MITNMVVDSDIIPFSIPQRYLLFAEAYAHTAESLTEKMVRGEKENTWPNASVVLMNSVHAVELLLKGLLLYHNASSKLGTHDIDELYKKYLIAYPDNTCGIEMPFTTDYGSLNEAEINKLKKSSPEPSILYRYPTKNGHVEWSGAQGFVAELFIPVIHRLKLDIGGAREKIT